MAFLVTRSYNSTFLVKSLFLDKIIQENMIQFKLNLTATRIEKDAKNSPLNAPEEKERIYPFECGSCENFWDLSVKAEFRSGIFRVEKSRVLFEKNGFGGNEILEKLEMKQILSRTYK